MSLLGLRFRTVASRLNLLNYHHPDLAFERVSNLVATHLTNRWDNPIAIGINQLMRFVPIALIVVP